MNNAEDLNVNQPTPYTGRVAPPTDVRADNDDAVAKARADRQEAIRVRQKGRGRHKRLSRATGMNGPDRAMLKANEARKHRNKAQILANADAKGNRSKIAEHIAKAVALEEDAKAIMAEHRDTTWANAANDETAFLAKGRGERVENHAGRLRIASRCGLTLANDSGDLEPTERGFCESQLYSVAKVYRDAYELWTGKRSARGEGSSGVKGPQVKPIEAQQALAVMRRGQSCEQIAAMDAVCGESQTLDAFATASRRDRQAARELLVSGLQGAILNIRADRAAKDTEDRITRDQMAKAHAAIVKAARSVA